MESYTRNATPAKESPLHHDTEGEPIDETWDYSSVVGMLLYLVKTCPDIQFAVHQCTKYAHHPRKSHGHAVKKICWYLQGTKDKGLCFSTKPILGPEIGVNCFVDTLFAPLRDIKDPTSSEGVKSQTGYIIHLNDWPVTWSSKKHSEVALSTTESWIPSMAMCELICIEWIVDEVATGLKMTHSHKAIIHSKVFEDNQGAIHVANHLDLIPWTWHIHTKYHHFKENVGLDEQGHGSHWNILNRRINWLIYSQKDWVHKPLSHYETNWWVGAREWLLACEGELKYVSTGTQQEEESLRSKFTMMINDWKSHLFIYFIPTSWQSRHLENILRSNCDVEWALICFSESYH